MKKLTFSFLIALTVLMVVAACSSASTPTPTTITPPKATATSAPEPTPTIITPPEATATSAPEPTATSALAVTLLTDAEMEALITEKTHDKHTLQFILSKNMTAEEWSKTIDKMISFGAKISLDEKVMIIDWLVARNK